VTVCSYSFNALRHPAADVPCTWAVNSAAELFAAEKEDQLQSTSKRLTEKEEELQSALKRLTEKEEQLQSAADGLTAKEDQLQAAARKVEVGQMQATSRCKNIHNPESQTPNLKLYPLPSSP